MVETHHTLALSIKKDVISIRKYRIGPSWTHIRSQIQKLLLLSDGPLRTLQLLFQFFFYKTRYYSVIWVHNLKSISWLLSLFKCLLLMLKTALLYYFRKKLFLWTIESHLKRNPPSLPCPRCIIAWSCTVLVNEKRKKKSFFFCNFRIFKLKKTFRFFIVVPP